MRKIIYIDEVNIKDKNVLLRVDFNVPLTKSKIANDFRISQTVPTITYLLKRKNKVIILSHLGQPKGKINKKYSLEIVYLRLKKFFPSYKIKFAKTIREARKSSTPLVLLENIRFFPQEENLSLKFAKKLASLANVYVNDAFGVCHRNNTSVTGIPLFLPSFGGLLLKKEVEIITQTVEKPKKPLVFIIGGAKISTKIGLIDKLIKIADCILIGGGLANTFLKAKNINIGNSLYEENALKEAKKILKKTKKRNKLNFILPTDALIANKDLNDLKVININAIPKGYSIFDIGPETKAQFSSFILRAKTIIWNGPVGYFEKEAFSQGTDFIYYSIVQNKRAISIVGGGDTLAAISKKEYLNKISHISTGGGAMLRLIEKGTLIGLEALKKSKETL